MNDNTQKQIFVFFLVVITLAGILFLAALYDATQPATAKLLSIDFHRPVLRAFTNFIVPTLAACVFYILQMKGLSIPSKPFYLAFLFSIILFGLAASLAIRYSSVVGWCCENPFAVFYGFPFSWLRAYPPDPYNYEWAMMNFINPLANYPEQASWQIQPLAFAFDLVFWLNSGLLVLLAPVIGRSRSNQL